MVHRKVCTVLYKKKWDFVMHIFFNVLRSGVSLEIIDIYLKRIFLCKLQKKTNIFHFFSIFSAMPTMLFMIWMEKTCKVDVYELN